MSANLLELKKGLSDAKAGKSIHFAFVKGGDESRLLMSKMPLKASTTEVVEAKKECKTQKLFLGVCGGLSDDGKVNFYMFGFKDDQEDKVLASQIEKTAMAAKIAVKVKATAAPKEMEPAESSEDETPPPPTQQPAPSLDENDKRFFEKKFGELKEGYEQALLAANSDLQSKLKTIFNLAKSHAQDGNYIKANQALAVLAVAIGKAKPVPTGDVKPVESSPSSEPPVATDKAAENFNSKLKEVQAILHTVIETAGFDPAVMKELQKMLKQAVVHKGQKDFEAGSELLDEILVKSNDGLKVAAKQTKTAPPKSESPKEKTERVLKERAEKRGRQELARRIELDTMIAAMPPEIDILGVRAIMQEHRKQVPNEEKAFAGMRFFDDVMLIEDEGKRGQRIDAINKAMLAVRSRQARMAMELANLPEPANDEQREAIAKAKGLRANMMNHIPDWWQANWTEDFIERVKVLSLSPKEKELRLAEAKKGFDPGEQGRQREVFKATVDPLSLKGFEQHDAFFDHLTRAPSTDELNEMAAVTRELLKKAREIRDCGGTLDDVKLAIKHVPETWWPDELVDYLQAWRKVERELREESVSSQTDDSGAIETVEGAIELFASVMEVAGMGTTWMENAKAAEAISAFTEEMSQGWGAGKNWGESIAAKDFSKFDLQAVEKFTDGALLSVKTFCTTISGIQEIAEIAPKESVMVAKVIPGLSIASAGIDLFLAIKKLAEHSKIAYGTVREIDVAERALALGKDEDGGAFVRTMKNERKGRIRQVSSDSVEVTSAGFELAGAITEATVVGGVAGKALTVTATAIEYGGKVVFTIANWKDADHAKKLIQEAQGGNPVARIEIMENCNLYAKMYIAVLCRDKHPLAKKFIEVRGIEEGDLTDATSLKILREALLASADQKDETQIADNLGVAIAEGTGFGLIPKAGRKIAELAETIKNKVVDRNAGDYDAKWKHEAKNVALTRTAWDTTKRAAFEKGLHDELTGLGAALEKVQPSLAKVNLQDKDKNTKEDIVAAVNDLRDAYERLSGYCPLTVPQGEKKEVEPHKGMTLYVVAMKTLTGTTLNQLDKLLVERKDRLPDWKTDKSLVEDKEWAKTWREGTAAAMLDADDHGVEKAISLALEAERNTNKEGVSPAKEREAKLKARDLFVEVVGKLDECWSAAGDCQGLREYVDRLKERATLKSRVFQKLLFQVTWDNPTASMSEEDKFSSAGWGKFWKAACDQGVVYEAKGEAGVPDALREVEAQTKVVGQTKDPKDLLKARQKLGGALTKVFTSATKFIGAQQKEAVADALLYANSIVKTAQQKLQALSGQVGAVKFAIAAGFAADKWKSTYEAAVKAGAVSEEKSLAAALEKALAAAVSEEEKFNSEKVPKQMRSLAGSAMQKLGEVQTAAGKMAAADGYSDHAIMGPYLDKLSTEAGKRMQSQEIKDVLEGAMPTAFGPQVFAWNKEGWLKAKNAAVEAGLFDSKNTGFTGVLGAAESAYQNWKTASEPEDKDKKAATAAAKIGEVGKMAKQFAAATKNQDWAKFFNDGISQAQERLKEMGKA